MEKNKRSRKGRGRKKKPKSSTAKKTPKKWSPRTRGYVALTNLSMEHGSHGRICQVLKINNDKTKIAVRYNYNGRDIVVPYNSVIKAPADWKKKDPVNPNYRKPFENVLQPHILEELQL
jgi:hypothetical protein